MIPILGTALIANGLTSVCVVSAQDSSTAKAPHQLVDLPQASSGEKEIDLVDQLYPETGDQEPRRQALERSIDYFPGDRVTAFRAGVRLAILDWNAGHATRAHDRLAQLLAGNAGRIERGIYSWAEIVDGRVLADLRRIPDSLRLLDRIAGDKALSVDRRVTAAMAAADIRAVASPQAALDSLEESASQGGLSGPSLEAGIARLLIATGKEDELEQRISDISGGGPKGDAMLSGVLESARTWNSPGDAARLSSLLNVIAKIRPVPGDELQRAVAKSRMAATSLAIQGQLEQLLAAKPLSDWYRGMPSDARTGLDDFARAIEQASKKSDPERCLRISLRALASHGADETFPRRIWEAAGYADWVERTEAGRIDPRACTVLLDLCDQFPPANPYFTEGKFLRAGRLAKTGDLVGQRKALSGILAVPGLSANYLAPACRMLGASHEAAGEYRQALEVYAQVEPVAVSHTAAAQCVLHAIWINLTLGNNLEAARLIRILSRAPPAVTRQMAGYAQLRELETLVRIGRADECWDAGRTWWAEWAKIAVGLGAPADLPEYAVPEIANVADLEDSIRLAVQKRDQAAYVRQLSVLMSAARWQPSLCPEAAALCAAAVKSPPNSNDDLRGFLIRMLASPHPPEIAGLRERKLCLAVNYLDVHQYTEVLRLAADFSAVKQPEDNTTMAMHRVRALAALSEGSDCAASAAELETDLSDPQAAVQRAMAVGLLSDIYEKLGRNADATKLLQRELNNPSIAADEQGRASLRARFAQISGSAVRPPEVAKWIRSAALNWYDHAEPTNLDDPRLANLEDALTNSERNFEPAEQAKLLLLAAGDLRRSPEDRNRSFLEAIVRIAGWAPDYARMEGLSASVINDPSFDVQTRLGLLWRVLTILAKEARKADYDSWRANDLCAQLSPEFKDRLAWLDREAALDRGSPEAILGLASTLGAQDLTASGVLTMQDCLDFLLRAGAITDAESLEEKASSWRFSSEVAPSADAVRLEFARQVRVAKSINPVHEALASAVQAQFPDVPAAMPVEYANLRIEARLPTRSPDATFRACLRLIAVRQFERNDFQFWRTLLQALPDGTAEAAGRLIRAGLAAAPDDEMRSQLIVLFFSSLNADDPLVRQQMEQEFARYRQPADSPRSYVMIRLYEIHRDLRLGKPASLETAFLDLNDPRVQVVKERACLRHYTQTQERGPLRRTIDQIDSGQLLSPGFLVQSVPALELVGSEPELKAARDASKRLLQRDVLESWACGNDAAGDAALDLALVLGDRAALPRAWVDEVSSGGGNPLFQGRALLTQAYLESNWADVARLAAALTHDYPSRYSFYWYRALALRHLGRQSEVADALEPFLMYGKDEPEYPKALELANTLQGNGT